MISVRYAFALSISVVVVLAMLPISAARAETVVTLAGPVEVPFAVEFVFSSEDRSLGTGFTANEVRNFRIAEGAAAGRMLNLSTRYYVPPSVSPAAMEHLLARLLEDAADKPRYVRSEPRSVSGFDFTLLINEFEVSENEADAPRDEFETAMHDPGPRRALTLIGLLSGALLNVTAVVPKDDHIEREFADAMAGLAIDFAGLLKSRGEFDAESNARVSEFRVATLFGDVTPPRGSRARMTHSHESYSADRERIARKYSFMFAKDGAWLGAQYVSLSTGCTSGRVMDAPMRAWMDEALTRNQSMREATPPSPARIGDREGHVRSARHAGQAGKTRVSRWLAFDERASFSVEIESLNARGILKHLESSLDGLRLDCSLL